MSRLSAPVVCQLPKLSAVVLVHSYHEYKYKTLWYSGELGTAWCQKTENKQDFQKPSSSNCDIQCHPDEILSCILFDNSVSSRKGSRNNEASIPRSMSPINCTNHSQWFSLNEHWNGSSARKQELVSEDLN